MPRRSAKVIAPTERGRLETAERAATAARNASQPKPGAAGDATTFEIGADGERIGSAGEATGATTGTGRTMDGRLWAHAGAAVKTMAADKMKAAARTMRRPNMADTIVVQPPAVKVCSDRAVCLPDKPMGS
jgi:hypothetical protein